MTTVEDSHRSYFPGLFHLPNSSYYCWRKISARLICCFWWPDTIFVCRISLYFYTPSSVKEVLHNKRKRERKHIETVRLEKANLANLLDFGPNHFPTIAAIGDGPKKETKSIKSTACSGAARPETAKSKWKHHMAGSRTCAKGGSVDNEAS